MLRSRSVRTRLVLAALSLGLVVPGLGVQAASASPVAAFSVGGSAQQVYVTGAQPGSTLTLVSPGGSDVATMTATSLGGTLFRDVPPGVGYTVRGADGATSPAVEVHDESSTPWDTIVLQPVHP